MPFKLRILNIFCFCFAAGIPFFDSFGIGGHRLGNLHQITVVVLALYLFLGTSFLKYNPWRNVKLTYVKYFLLFNAGIFASFLLSGSITSLSVQHMTFYFELAFIYLLFSEVIFDSTTVRSFYYGLTLGLALSVFIGVMQFLKVPAFNLFKDDDLNANTSYVSEGDAVDVLRVWGPFGNALSFSFYLSVAGMLSFYFFHSVRKKKLISWAIFGMSILGICLTISRMALFAFIFCVALVYYLSIDRRRRARFMAVIIVLAIVGILGLSAIASNDPILSRFSASQDDFETGRLALWDVGYRVWMNNLFFGTGPGNLNEQLYNNGWRIVGKDIIETTPGHVENYYLTVLFTFGLVPFLIFAVYLTKLVQACYRLLKAGLADKNLADAIPLLGGVVCLLLNNLINPVMNSDIRIQLLMVLQMAICTGLYRKFATTPEYESTSGSSDLSVPKVWRHI
jgi:hypothetical protein